MDSATSRGVMRGAGEKSRSLFSHVDLEKCIPARHPLRRIRQGVNDARASPDAEVEALCTGSFRAERQLLEQMHDTLMLRRFLGLGIDDPARVPTVSPGTATAF